MLTDNINLPEKSDHLFITGPIEKATHIFFGGIVATNPAGNMVPAEDTAGLIVRGVAEQEVDNTNGEAGDKTVVAKRAPRWVPNSAIHPLGPDDVGKVCFIEDDNTVARTSGSKIVAGITLELSADGSVVCVDFFLAAAGAAAAPESETSEGSSEESSHPPASSEASSSSAAE